MTAFVPKVTLGQQIFYTLGNAYAPPLDELPAQLFLGEWTGNPAGCDVAVWEPDSGRWRTIAIEGDQISSHLFVDPYRPVVYVSTNAALLKIDRETLAVSKVAPIKRRYSADVDEQGHLWMIQGRTLMQINPDSGEVTDYGTVGPAAYDYPQGTHGVLGVSGDGSVWISQGPRRCIYRFYPASCSSELLWGEDQSGHNVSGIGQPLVGETVAWVGRFVFDRDSGERLDIDGDAYLPLTRRTWSRTPTAHAVRGDSFLARRGEAIGWWSPRSGLFREVGALPLAFWDRLGYGFSALHEDRQVILTSKTGLSVGDLATGKWQDLPNQTEPTHPQAMFSWTIGPDGCVYGSCYSHDLLRGEADGSVEDLGDVVQVAGGELWGFAAYRDRLYITSYTHSVLTRLDLTRPAAGWGTDATSNPRHLLSLGDTREGHHRPSAVVVHEADRKLYYISRTDYCTRREGALVVVDLETETVEQIVDPLIPGEQLWTLAAGPHRSELYIGGDDGSLIVWDTRRQVSRRQYQLPVLDSEGQPTSAEIKTGGIRYTAAAGDLVVGNHWGSMEIFIYNAATGELRSRLAHPAGKVYGVYRWGARDSLLLTTSSGLFEMHPLHGHRLLYESPLPGAYLREGPDGTLYLSDRVTIFAETGPAIGRQLPAFIPPFYLEMTV